MNALFALNVHGKKGTGNRSKANTWPKGVSGKQNKFEYNPVVEETSELLFPSFDPTDQDDVVGSYLTHFVIQIHVFYGNKGLCPLFTTLQIKISSIKRIEKKYVQTKTPRLENEIPLSECMQDA